MRTNNPILSRPDAFTAGHVRAAGGAIYQPQGYAQPGYGPQGGYGQPGYGTQGGYGPQSGYLPTARMTIDDVITKTLTLMGVLVVVAAATWILLPPALLMPVAVIASLVAFVTVLIVSIRRTLSVPLVIGYAVLEGALLGAWSRVIEGIYPGIVTEAVLGTFVAAFVTLFAYRNLGVRVQGRLARVVVFSIVGYAVAMLLNLVVMLFGGNLGLANVGPNPGIWSWAAALLGVVLAVASLLMDFEAIEDGVRQGAPAQESWRGAFGILVTMVWLYTTLLRILSYFRS